MKFWKMEAAGNDFVIFDGRNVKIEDAENLAKNLCDRHFGVGADGILFYQESQNADLRMHYYNSDGSRGEMCGNGIRCLARYVYETGFLDKTAFTIETDDGIKEIELFLGEKKEVLSVKVGMGSPVWEEKFQEETIIFPEGKEFKFYRVQVGVPHIIIFVEEFMEDNDLNYWGKKLEHHPSFPKKTNVNFVKILSKDRVEMRTWERGAGRTLGCSTGCSSATAVLRRLKEWEETIEFKTEGGCISAYMKNDKITIFGRANLIFQGEIYG